MKVKQAKEEAPDEQLLAELGAYLEEADTLLLSSLETRVRVIRAHYRKACQLVSRLRLQLVQEKRE